MPSPSVAAGVDPITRKEVEAVIKQRLAKLNLTDIDGVATDLVRDVERDADGNVVLGGVVTEQRQVYIRPAGRGSYSFLLTASWQKAQTPRTRQDYRRSS